MRLLITLLAVAVIAACNDAETKTEEAPKVEAPKPAAAPAATYATNSPSPAAKKILDEKGIDAAAVSGTGRASRRREPRPAAAGYGGRGGARAPAERDRRRAAG